MAVDSGNNICSWMLKTSLRLLGDGYRVRGSLNLVCRSGEEAGIYKSKNSGSRGGDAVF